jgi:hypothetical protein
MCAEVTVMPADEFALLKNVFGVEEKPAVEEAAPSSSDATAPGEGAHSVVVANKWGVSPLKVAFEKRAIELGQSFMEWSEANTCAAAAAMAIPSHLLVERQDVERAAQTVVEATAWKIVDGRKVEVSAAEWDAAVLVARAWLAQRPAKLTPPSAR